MITTDKVKELRDKSGAGMMDCKRALAAAAGDLDRAIDFLRKEGVVKASKKAGRPTLEGLVAIASSPDRRWFSVVELNCETDFVARTDPFQSFLATVAEQVVRDRPKDLDALLAQNISDTTLQEGLSQLIARLGENMSIRRFRLVGCGPGESAASYLHAGSKIGVLVKLKGFSGESESLAREIAMHVAAMAPRYVDRSQVPAEVVLREKEIAQSAPEILGKPEHLLDRILEGKLNRYYSDACLLEQPFVKDPTGKKTVAEFLREQGKGATVVEVVRFQVGEEIV